MAPYDPTNLIATADGPDQASITWNNNHYWAQNLIERKPSGGGWTEIDQVSGYDDSYVDTTVEDGIEYSYQVRGHDYEPESYSNYTNEDSCIIPCHEPANLIGTCISPTQIKLDWTDQSEHESGFKIYKNGTYLDSVGAGVQTYTAGSLNSGTWYLFKVKAYNAITESAYSNEVNTFTYDPPNAPSNLQAQSVSTSQINLTWQDNSTNEDDFHIEESSTGPTSGFSEIATVGAGITYYERTGRSGGTQYWYRVRAQNTSDYSAYCAVANAITQGAVSKPSNVQLFSAVGTEVEIVFQDNSTDEDYHSIERKTGAGGSYAEVKQLEPNRTYWKDTGRTAGTEYFYQIRGKQGVVYSSYSDEVSITTLVTPSTPTGLAVGSHLDTWMKLTWAKVSTAQGYKLYRSTNGSTYPLFLTIQRNDVLALGIMGLNVNTLYYWKISAYNGNGESSLSTAVSHTTDAQYSETAWERYSRKTSLNMIILVEINPKIELSGFALTGGRTYTYEIVVQERGIDISSVLENGTAYTEKASINDVESNASTFYFDYANRKLYVHTSAGNAPINYQIDAGFWLYFTNYRRGLATGDFNSNNYLPLISRSDIPDVSQEVKSLYEGSLSMTTGSVSIMNPKVGSSHYFDKIYKRYKWENSRVILKAGGPGFTYSQFQTIMTGVIEGKYIDDVKLTLELTDFREGVWRSIPIAECWSDEYPNLDDSGKGRKKPFGYGSVTSAQALLVDTTSKKYLFHDGRVKTVTSVKVNGGSALTEGTDYFINYRKGIVEFAEAYSVTSSDVVTVTFQGAMEEYGTDLIEDGAEIFIDILTRFLGLTVDDLDLDSIYYVKKNSGKTLAGYLYEEKSSNDVIKTIEQSLLCFSRQDESGKLGLKLIETTAPSNVRSVRQHQIKEVKSATNRESLIRTVNVYWGLVPSTNSWSRVVRTKPGMGYAYKIYDVVDIRTWCSSEANAIIVATAFLAQLEKESIEFNTSPHLFGCLAGDLIYMTRDRFFNLNGALNNTLVRILGISKSPSGNQTSLKVELVNE